jgi:hypothetical protein
MRKPDLTSRLDLDTLDQRIVPSTMIDLTHRGDSSFAGAAIVSQCDAQPTGTGLIRSFVRIQGAASGGGSEQGYNTDARPLQFDENKSPQFTRSLTADLVPTVMINGVAYREFLLDINQKASSSKLSVDDIRIFLGGAPNLTATAAEASSGVHTLSGLSPVYDLNGGGADQSIMLDASLNNGSGSGDMFLLVPDSAFAGAGSGTYVYLYSRMGAAAGATANGGFEEWAVSAGVASTPVTGSASLSGHVYFDMNGNNHFDPGEGVQGVTVELRVTFDNGLTVSVGSVQTAVDGSYSFTGLPLGTYTILKTQPAGYQEGNDQIGTVNGATDGFLLQDRVLGNDQFYGIILNAGDQGINYDFGLTLG